MFCCHPANERQKKLTRLIYVGLRYGEDLPYEFWRVHLAKTFGQTPASIDGWRAQDFYETIHVLNAIANAEAGGRKEG